MKSEEGEKDLGFAAGAAPIAPVQAESAAACAEDKSRAFSIACGSGVLPSQGDWSAYRDRQFEDIPNYWTIASADYTDSGFSVTGYIHDDDARIMGAAKDMRAALELFIKQWNACGSNSDFGRYFSNVRRAAEAALAKAEGRT